MTAPYQSNQVDRWSHELGKFTPTSIVVFVHGLSLVSRNYLGISMKDDQHSLVTAPVLGAAFREAIFGWVDATS